MKIRNGFVSNSSSSSFVVVVPKDIQSAEQMHQYLFKTDREYIIEVYDYKMTSGDVARKFLDDHMSFITDDNDFLDILTKEFSYRYSIWNTNDSCHPSYVKLRHGYYLRNEGEQYCGTDKKLVKQLIDNHKKYRKAIEKIDEKKSKFLKRNGVDEYDYTNKFYTDFVKNNKEYNELCEKRKEQYQQMFIEETFLKNELAKKDCAEFLKTIDQEKMVISIVSYRDNDDDGMSLMEHGDIFKNVPHIRISHH